MFFTSCWQGWTLWNGSSSPCRNPRPTTTSTRWGQGLMQGPCAGNGLGPGVCRGARIERSRGWPGPAPQPCSVLQGRACRLPGKEDAQDFAGLVKALQALGLCPEELTAIWALLATTLHLGNICFSSSEVSSPECMACLHDQGSRHNAKHLHVADCKALGHPQSLMAALGSRQTPIVYTRKLGPRCPAPISMPVSQNCHP